MLKGPLRNNLKIFFLVAARPSALNLTLFIAQRKRKKKTIQICDAPGSPTSNKKNLQFLAFTTLYLLSL